jgi:hypothetical protein
MVRETAYNRKSSAYRADAGETIINTIDFPQTLDTIEQDTSRDKIKALAEIICRAGDEALALAVSDS